MDKTLCDYANFYRSVDLKLFDEYILNIFNRITLKQIDT